MSSHKFIKDVVTYVNSLVPNTHWELGRDFAVLTLKAQDKSILFLCDEALDYNSRDSSWYFITEKYWNRNIEASKSRLCSILGVTRRIHGRKCTIKKINKKEAKLFTDTNHIMGYATAHINYGLFLNNDVVAVACFSKGRRMNRLPPNMKSFELVRFCNKNYHTVVGGLSKLIHFFERELIPGDIMTYVDGNWGQPHAYYALGFELDKIIQNSIPNVPDKNSDLNIDKGNFKLIKHLV